MKQDASFRNLEVESLRLQSKDGTKELRLCASAHSVGLSVRDISSGRIASISASENADVAIELFDGRDLSHPVLRLAICDRGAVVEMTTPDGCTIPQRLSAEDLKKLQVLLSTLMRI